MHIKYSDTNKKEVGSMKLAEYKINPDFSGTLIEMDGEHGKIKCIGEDRIYFILEGTGKFIIDEEEYEVSKNDLIFIPKNTPYNVIGKMKYFLLHSPEFNKEHDIKLN
ncbi:cupin domain-containing protein [bacterium]|nr:MAG: cupin domain-containing protein [bacterium]